LAKSIKIKSKQYKTKFFTIAREAIKKIKKLKPSTSSKLKQFKIPQIIKNQKSSMRINDIAKLEISKRIGDSGNPPSITIPSPKEDFGFPMDVNDKVRISGEVEVQRLYELACSTGSNSSENDAIIQRMKPIANAIYSNYSNYPDLCAISKLYMIDAEAHFGLPGEFSNGTFSSNFMVEVSNRDFVKRYLQIMTDYTHETSKPNISKLIDYIYKNRIEKIFEADKGAQAAIESNYAKAERDMALLNTIINETAYTDYDEDAVKSYVKTVVSIMNAIIADYERIHYFSVMSSDYETAEHFFNSEYKDGKLSFSGVIKELYDSIPKELPFNYVTGYDAQHNPIIETKMVETYREPAYIIEAIKSHRNAEMLKYSHTFLNDENNTNLTQEKVKAIGEWLKNYEPDREGKNGTPEKMSPEDVNELHNTAYGPNDYYKNSHVIKKIYFTKTENLEMIDDIPSPSDFINIRAEVEASSPSAPFYEYKIKIENVQDPNRFKTLTMKKDFNSGGYYAKFQPNETDDPKDKSKNLINNEKDAFKESIAVFTCDNKPNESISPIYNNTYFKYKAGHSNTTETTFDVNTKDFSKLIFKNSVSFLKAGGAEYIFATMNKLKTYALIRNQADWFLIDAHGRIHKHPDGGVSDDSSNPVYITPEQLYNNGKSEYAEDIKILILLACGVLKWQESNDMTFARGWHKVMSGEEQAALGYHHEISTDFARTALAKFNASIEKVTQELKPEDVIARWEIVNEDMFKEYLKFKAGDPEYQEGGEKYVKGIENYIDGAYYSDINSKFWVGGGIERIPVTRKERGKPTEFLLKIKPSFKLFEGDKL